MPSSRDLPNPGIELRYPTLQVNSLPAEPPGKPKIWSQLESVLYLVSQSSDSCDPVSCSLPGSSVHGDSPGKNTGVGCHALLQGSSQFRGIKLWAGINIHVESYIYIKLFIKTLFFVLELAEVIE